MQVVPLLLSLLCCPRQEHSMQVVPLLLLLLHLLTEELPS